jgi:hypothetical protein
MKNKLTLFGSLSIAILILYTVSCRKDTTENSTNVSSPQKSLEINSKSYETTKMGVKEINSKTTSKYSKVDDYPERPGLMANLNSTSVYEVLIDLKQHFDGSIDNISDTPRVMVFHTNGSLSNINYSDVLAISVFTENNGVLNHTLHSVNNNETTLDSRFTKSTNYFTSIEINLLSTIVSPNTNLGHSIIINNTLGNSYNRYLNNPSYAFNQTVYDRSNQAPKPPEGGGGCGMCGGGNGSCDMSGGCVPNDCGKNTTDQTGTDNNLISASAIYNNQIGYDFRDNLLSQYQLGQKYIAYYYHLSYVVRTFSTINVSNFAKHFELCGLIYQSVDILTNGSNDNIPISSELKAKGIDLINDYRDYSDNEEYLKMLDNITADLTKYEGKTKSYILNDIQ